MYINIIQIAGSRKLIPCFREAFSHPYIPCFHLLVNGFSVTNNTYAVFALCPIRTLTIKMVPMTGRASSFLEFFCMYLR